VKEQLDPDRVFLLHGFLSGKECAAFIRRSETLHYEIGTVGGVVTEGVRKNERVLVDDQHLAENLHFSDLSQALNRGVVLR